jgi:hypothetical protein
VCPSFIPKHGSFVTNLVEIVLQARVTHQKQTFVFSKGSFIAVHEVAPPGQRGVVATHRQLDQNIMLKVFTHHFLFLEHFSVFKFQFFKVRLRLIKSLFIKVIRRMYFADLLNVFQEIKNFAMGIFDQLILSLKPVLILDFYFLVTHGFRFDFHILFHLLLLHCLVLRYRYQPLVLINFVGLGNK